MDLLISLIKVVTILLVVLNFLPLVIWMERKGAAYFQDRRGPNRAKILGIRLGGMIHNIADVIKLITKEEFFPERAHRFYFILAPFLLLFIYMITVAVIPFGDDLRLGELTISLQIADLNVGILYIFAMSSLAVYGIMLAGWSSGNKYSLLGALRASSQMISYEIALGLSIVSLFMVAESVSLNDIIRHQTASPFSWNIVRQPLAFLLFLVASFAETNRTPFDLPEGESELVAGYHVEYSSMKFALFYMGEYVAIIVSSAIIACLFFGGWQVPFLGTTELMKMTSGLEQFRAWAPTVTVALIQITAFLAKIFFLCFFFIWVRWTLPRFRYDQLMSLGWKGLLPLSLGNILLTAGILFAQSHFLTK